MKIFRTLFPLVCLVLAFIAINARADASIPPLTARVVDAGILIYLLLADRDVEIIADRGIHAKVDMEEWEPVCRAMEADFRETIKMAQSGVLNRSRSY
ncbi:hypothetical protein [Paraburkholderia sp. SARCC-3016]|uniref:hypothetical protein n=1 Tax=Paraburkholderia sp. SARCC-3016 TaxID=3058611 RepID=UPI0035BE87C4